MPSRSSVPYRPLIRTTAAGALLVTALFAATPAEAVGQEETSDRTAADPADVESPGAVVEALAESFSSEAGERPEWDRYRSLFLPKARLVRTGRDSAGEPYHGVWTVQQVIESVDAEQRIEEHAVEQVVHEEIDRFGDIAHVLYTYEVFESADHAEPVSRGVASMQLWHDGDRWWIVSLTWHPEREGAPIPERYGG